MLYGTFLYPRPIPLFLFSIKITWGIKPLFRYFGDIPYWNKHHTPLTEQIPEIHGHLATFHSTVWHFFLPPIPLFLYSIKIMWAIRKATFSLIWHHIHHTPLSETRNPWPFFSFYCVPLFLYSHSSFPLFNKDNVSHKATFLPTFSFVFETFRAFSTCDNAGHFKMVIRNDKNQSAKVL